MVWDLGWGSLFCFVNITLLFPPGSWTWNCFTNIWKGLSLLHWIASVIATSQLSTPVCMAYQTPYSGSSIFVFTCLSAPQLMTNKQWNWVKQFFFLLLLLLPKMAFRLNFTIVFTDSKIRLSENLKVLLNFNLDTSNTFTMWASPIYYHDHCISLP